MNEQKIHTLKARLRREAEKKFPDDKERQDKYVWGTIQKIKKRGRDA